MDIQNNLKEIHQINQLSFVELAKCSESSFHVDQTWLTERPSTGSYTVLNVTQYSSGHSEATATTIFDPQIFRRKIKDDNNEDDNNVDDDVINNDDSVNTLDIIKEKTEFEDKENKERSLRRTKKTVRKKIIEGELDHFLTLTYLENKQDLKECWLDWKKFIRIVQKKYPSLKYLVIVERQKRGAVHFHAAVHGYLHANTLRALWLSVVGKGNIDIKRRKHNQSMHRLASYMTKYLTKQQYELDSFTNLYRCSRNIVLKVIKLYLPKEYAMIRQQEIDIAFSNFVGNIQQKWDDSNGLFSCHWASSLAP